MIESNTMRFRQPNRAYGVGHWSVALVFHSGLALRALFSGHERLREPLCACPEVSNQGQFESTDYPDPAGISRRTKRQKPHIMPGTAAQLLEQLSKEKRENGYMLKQNLAAIPYQSR